jgi:hypothetical protein
MVPITVTKPIKSLFFITGPSSLFRSTGARLLARISDFDGPSSSLSYTRTRQSDRDSHRSLSPIFAPAVDDAVAFMGAC